MDLAFLLGAPVLLGLLLTVLKAKFFSSSSLSQSLLLIARLPFVAGAAVYKSVDFWEGVKALFSGIIWSGPVLYCLVFQLDPQKMSLDTFMPSAAFGVVFGFLGVVVSNRYIRRLNSGSSHP